MKEVQVKVPGHSYTIKLGSGVIKELPAELKRLNPSSCLIATNITVGSLYLKKATDPVSYTHLDVYKRQALAWLR